MIVNRRELEAWLKAREVTDYRLPTLKRDLLIDSPYFGLTRIVCFQRNPTKYQIREDGSSRSIPIL